MRILQIWLSEIDKISKDLLDIATASLGGKKENNYWIINASQRLALQFPQYINEIHGLNTLLQITENKDYHCLMVIDR